MTRDEAHFERRQQLDIDSYRAPYFGLGDRQGPPEELLAVCSIDITA